MTREGALAVMIAIAAARARAAGVGVVAAQPPRLRPSHAPVGEAPGRRRGPAAIHDSALRRHDAHGRAAGATRHPRSRLPLAGGSDRDRRGRRARPDRSAALLPPDRTRSSRSARRPSRSTASSNATGWSASRGRTDDRNGRRLLLPPSGRLVPRRRRRDRRTLASTARTGTRRHDASLHHRPRRPRARGRHPPRRARLRRARHDPRRGGLRDRHDRLPGDPHRPLLRRPDRAADRPAHRQHRNERRGPRVPAHLGLGLHRARPLARRLELARRRVARRRARQRRRRRHQRHRHPRRHAPHPLRRQHARRDLLGGCRAPQRRRAARDRAGRARRCRDRTSRLQVSVAARRGDRGDRRAHRQPRRARPRRQAGDDPQPRRSRIRRARASRRTSRSSDIRAIDPVAVFYSNGPGDPAASGDHVELLRGVLDDGLPFFGICFGNQLLGRALGLGTYKLPFGHRGINQPVLDKQHRTGGDHVAQPRLRRRRAAGGRRSTARTATDASR